MKTEIGRHLIEKSNKWVTGLSKSRFNCFPWNDACPIREELFSIERIELHAQNLAQSQIVTLTPQKVVSLHARLDDNERSLLMAYRGSIIELDNNRSVVPAAEWLLDNFHLVEAQIREVRDDLSPRFYKQLPKLANGPWKGYPRVLSLAWAYIAHTDSHFDPEMSRLFLNAYQNIQPLTIGELWAAGITLRIVLIENLRRLADQIGLARIERQDANTLADKLLHNGNAHLALQEDIAERRNVCAIRILKPCQPWHGWKNACNHRISL